MNRLADNILEELIRSGESDRVERKKALSDPAEVRKAICAFANDLPNHREPGIVAIGVDDDGNPCGTPITDELLRNLSDMRSDGNITPFPTMTVEARDYEDSKIAVIVVYPSLSPPVRYKGTVYIRTGPRRGQASSDEERRLAEKRRAGDLSYDMCACEGATTDGLDMRLFEDQYLPQAVSPEVLAENNRSVEQQLVSLHFAIQRDEPQPTNLGLLMVGQEPQYFIPGAYIQFLRIDGQDLTDPIINQKEVRHPLVSALRYLDELLEVHIRTALNIAGGPTDEKRPDYPLVALQQIARNAVLHRNYETSNAPVRITWFNDRVEILSPGGPYGVVTRENFGQPEVTDYRNPGLAEAMKNLGYVQRFGWGIASARKYMNDNGNPEIEFQVTDSHVLAVLRRTQ